jgi:hypothetical protein
VKWATAWQLLKDILLTGTGLALIVSQILAKQPSDVLLVTGLALTVPSAASHAGALLSGPSRLSEPEDGERESSPHAASPGAPGSPSSSPGGTGE